MYKLLIVDDEPLVQVGIKSMLPWSTMGIEIAGIAANGKAALEIIEKDHPDIVITDIKMPIMSGLELAEECQKRFDGKPYFIVLTSYEDFELARRALTARVSDYLVKLDLTPEQLRASVEKLIGILDKEKAQAPKQEQEITPIASYRDKFFISLLCNLFADREQFELQAKELSLSFDLPYYLCCYCEVIGPAEAQINLYHSAFQMAQNLTNKYMKSHVTMLDLHHFAIIFCKEECFVLDEVSSILQNISNTLSNYYNVKLHAGIGTKVSDPLAITESYQYSRDALTTANEEHPIVVFQENAVIPKSSFNFSLFKDSLAQAFEEYDGERLQSILSEIIDLFKAHPGHYLQAMDFASNLLYLSISLLPNGEETVNQIFEDNSKGYQSLYALTTMDQVIAYVNNFSERLCNYFTERRKEVRKPIVAQVKRYIRDNISERLTLNEVAAVFGISPNYLSQLFKKYNDCGFNDYITNCKIDEAKRLLSEGGYKVYEVADMLGFESAFYFSKVFTKVVGIPPTEYLK